MKKVIERLAIFFIGIPAIFSLVFFLPFYNNVALNIVIVFFSGLGAVEFSSMLEKKNIRIPKAESFILGAIAPLAAMLYISFGLPTWLTLVILMSGAGWALISRIFSKSSEIESVTNKIIGSLSLIVYPGLFMCWIIFMCGWGNPGAVLLFLFITFGNDSFAWLFGSLFGKNNRGVIAVSPNKSIAGFIGGLLGSVIVAIGAVYIFPGIFPGCFECTPFVYMLLFSSIVGLCTGIAASLGDLAESAIKRSCDFVDSGNFILGRGGVLDSIDSIAVAAPVFYLLFSLLFNC